MGMNQFNRRDFIKKSVLAGAVLPFAGKGLFADTKEKSNKSVLMVWGGWEGHEPKQCVDIFAPWLEKQGFDVEISNTLDSYLDEKNLSSKDLIVQGREYADKRPLQGSEKWSWSCRLARRPG